MLISTTLYSIIQLKSIAKRATYIIRTVSISLVHRLKHDVEERHRQHVQSKTPPDCVILQFIHWTSVIGDY